MDSVRAFRDIPVDNIQAYLAKQNVPFHASELYSSTNQVKVLDLDKRRSQFRLLKDDRIFELMDAVVQKLNVDDPNYDYILVKNDITEIRYKKGDFFSRHTDFLTITSNLVIELTLVLCVTPYHQGGVVKKIVAGGDTLVYPYGSNDSKAVNFDTTTPGSGVIFRKDMEHAGAILEEGEKHILTANLIATRKRKPFPVAAAAAAAAAPSSASIAPLPPDNPQVLLITFPQEKTPKNKRARLSLEEVSNEATSYALPVDLLEGTMLGAHVEFCNRKAQQQAAEIQSLLIFECTDFTHEAFGVVYSILHQSYVDEEQIKKHINCIDYFGPFHLENMFVNLSVDPKPNEKTKKDVPVPPQMKQENLDLIVCENESRTKAVCEVSRLLNKPYVPFKILFVEGLLHSFDGDGGHAGYSSVPVTPVACLVGDYNNIFSLRKVNSRMYSLGALTLKEIHEQYYLWSDLAPLYESVWDDGPPSFTIMTGEDGMVRLPNPLYECHQRVELRFGGFGLGMKVMYGANEKYHDKLMTYIFDDPHDDKKSNCFPLLPGCEGDCLRFETGRQDNPIVPSVPPPEENKEGMGGGYSNSLFHRDEHGRTAFTPQEAGRASDFIASFGLDERVKARLQQNKRFVLPQESTEFEGHFCNDEVYGKLNILEVSGALRLAESSPPTAMIEDGGNKTVEFDVWPAECNQTDARTHRKSGWYYPSDDEDETFQWEEC